MIVITPAVVALRGGGGGGGRLHIHTHIVCPAYALEGGRKGFVRLIRSPFSAHVVEVETSSPPPPPPSRLLHCWGNRGRGGGVYQYFMSVAQ